MLRLVCDIHQGLANGQTQPLSDPTLTKVEDPSLSKVATEGTVLWDRTLVGGALGSKELSTPFFGQSTVPSPFFHHLLFETVPSQCEPSSTFPILADDV